VTSRRCGSADRFLSEGVLAIWRNLLYKLPRAYGTTNYNFQVFNQEVPMKKLLCVVSVLMMSLVVVGCGNSPDGDKQKIEAPVAPSL